MKLAVVVVALLFLCLESVLCSPVVVDKESETALIQVGAPIVHDPYDGVLSGTTFAIVGLIMLVTYLAPILSPTSFFSKEDAEWWRKANFNQPYKSARELFVLLEQDIDSMKNLPHSAPDIRVWKDWEDWTFGEFNNQLSSLSSEAESLHVGKSWRSNLVVDLGSDFSALVRRVLSDGKGWGMSWDTLRFKRLSVQRWEAELAFGDTDYRLFSSFTKWIIRDILRVASLTNEDKQRVLTLYILLTQSIFPKLLELQTNRLVKMPVASDIIEGIETLDKDELIQFFLIQPTDGVFTAIAADLNNLESVFLDWKKSEEAPGGEDGDARHIFDFISFFVHHTKVAVADTAVKEKICLDPLNPNCYLSEWPMYSRLHSETLVKMKRTNVDGLLRANGFTKAEMFALICSKTFALPSLCAKGGSRKFEDFEVVVVDGKVQEDEVVEVPEIKHFIAISSLPLAQTTRFFELSLSR